MLGLVYYQAHLFLGVLIDMTNDKLSVNMRVNVGQMKIIDIAAKLIGKDRTSFIIDAAVEKAENVVLGSDDFQAFAKALDGQ